MVSVEPQTSARRRASPRPQPTPASKQRRAATGEVGAWLAEHERVIYSLRDRVTELERANERTADLALPTTIAIAALAALPLVSCLPWLYSRDTPVTGWTLVVMWLDKPAFACAMFAVVVAMAVQAVGLALRHVATALAAAITCAAASCTLGFFITNVAQEREYDPASGPIVCLAILLSACVAWISITVMLRN